MSLSSLVSLDRMTVRAPHFALGYFRLGLSKALRVTHIEHLVAKMVEMKRVRVRPVPTVYAAGRDLECIQPTSDARGAFVGNSVHAFSIPRLFQSRGFSHGGTLRSLIEAMRDYIRFGTPIHPEIIAPAMSYGDMWGYGAEAAAAVRAEAHQLPLFAQRAAAQNKGE